MTARAFVIAVDGPAAAGKGTLARRLADHFHLNYLDTGLLYRAVGALVVRAGNDPSDAEAAAEAARKLDPAVLDDPSLRGETAGAAASKVAALPAVRQALLAFQRDYAAKPPGAVLDGRDIGTVICPGADVKLFVTASLEARAERRWKELLAGENSAIGVRGMDSDEFRRIFEEMRERDELDRTRPVAPLKAAPDAVLLDTTHLDADAAFAAAVEIVGRRR